MDTCVIHNARAIQTSWSPTAGLFALARSGALSVPQVLVSLVVITLFVPCVANVLVIGREHGAKVAAWVVGFVFPFAFAVGVLLHFGLLTFGVHF